MNWLLSSTKELNVCITVDEEMVQRVRNELETKGKITTYKVLRVDKGNFYSPVYSMQWQLGWNDRRPNFNGDEPEDDGIHVFLEKEVAENVAKCIQGKVIEVECYLEDFVTAGKHSSICWYIPDLPYGIAVGLQSVESAVFKRVFWR